MTLMRTRWAAIGAALARPGDHLMIALNRRAGAETTDTCTAAMIVLGLEVGPA